MASLCAALAIVPLLEVAAWREWPHSGVGTAKWKRNWLPADEWNKTYWGGPGGRYGHSLVLHDTQVVLFGGRADDIAKVHVPKTYTVQDRNGTIDFASYWERVYDCAYLLRKARFTEPNATLESIRCNATLAARAAINTTFLWNDVWMYDLNCTRAWQQGCSGNVTSQWTVLHEGAVDGGCRNVVEGRGGTREVCSTPSARYFHGAARFNDSTMLVYGGFSHRCEEYCDDVWALDLRYGAYKWTEVYPLDYFSTAQGQGPGRRWKFSTVTDGLSMAIFGGATLWDGYLAEGDTVLGGDGQPPGSGGGPNVGKGRGGGYLDDFWVYRRRPLVRGWGGMDHFMGDVPLTNKFAYGGGADPENYARYWEQVPVSGADSLGFWERVNVTVQCEADNRVAGRRDQDNAWADRDAVSCRHFWPTGRAGHVAVLDEARNGMWLHGGFTSHFPYPAAQSEGAKADGTGGRLPFGTFSYYLDDLWFFNFSLPNDRFGGSMAHEGGTWTQLRPLGSGRGGGGGWGGGGVPSGRMEHTLLLVTVRGGGAYATAGEAYSWRGAHSGAALNVRPVGGDVLLLQGGFDTNSHLNDTWLYNISTGRWLQKHTFERARYPPNCTEDAALFSDESSGCFELEWPQDRTRDAYYPFEPLPDRAQRWFAPDFRRENASNSYYGILDLGEHIEVGKLLNAHWLNGSSDQGGYGAPGRFGATAPDGTPLVPYAKTGPRQWVRNASANEALLLGLPQANVTVYERCTSVYGEPTRNTLLDGRFGRWTEPVLVAQPRRQRPGWDGCRDRHDNRSDLPHALQWDHPPQRSGHATVYSPDYGVMVVYGGRGPAREEPHRDATTFDFQVKHDFWHFSIYNCANNCSNHGFCSYGYCTCEDGYYGYDCSNTSCPGDYCYYDEYTHEQVCQHCCSAGYEHSDADAYVDRADSRKVPCSATEAGLSHGVCDGFGTCQCAPPFLGEDCSIKDCPMNCGYNGYCSVEWPVSRCVCNPSYFGEHCELIECLNNCSYPNGLCNYTDGQCYCNHLYNPYENTKRWATKWANYPREDEDGVHHGGVRWEGEDCSYLTAYAAATRAHSKGGAAALLLLVVVVVVVALLGLPAAAALDAGRPRLE